MSEPPVIEVENLHIEFRTDHGVVRAVRGVSFDLHRGRTLALVGESGSGKSMTGYALLKLVPAPGHITAGRIVLHSPGAADFDITAARDDSRALRALRGGHVSMIFQEPMTALSPVHTVGSQVAEAIRLHRGATAAEARRLAIAMFDDVGISDPDRRFDQYPHEISGGMRQRVVIAMALVCRPEVLVADEPTTALDVTIQAQILGLIKKLQREFNCAVLLITHDFGVVAQMADDVAVMQQGCIVERGEVRSVLREPRHPYTRTLLAAVPGRRPSRV